jgi:hypothetical protein
MKPSSYLTMSRHTKIVSDLRLGAMVIVFLRDDVDLVALAAGRPVGSVDVEQMDRRQ